jgi:ATP-dependent RNA helicase DeaD
MDQQGKGRTIIDRMGEILFTDLNLSDPLMRAINDLGITVLTEIQEKTIPVMTQGRDVIGQAPTGTGKTFAFGIPII